MISFIERIIFQEAAPGTYFVSDNRDLNLAELLELVGQVNGSKPFLFAFPPRLIKLSLSFVGKLDIYRKINGNLQVNIEKSRTTLDWVPPFKVEEGIRKTIKSV